MTERIQSPRVASILGVTTKTVREMAERGDLPSAARIGKRWTFNEAAVRSWLKRKEGEACPAVFTGAARRGGAVLSLPDATVDAAYEREIGLRRRSG
jgi:excisionase family DNA binding protein